MRNTIRWVRWPLPVEGDAQHHQVGSGGLCSRLQACRCTHACATPSGGWPPPVAVQAAADASAHACSMLRCATDAPIFFCLVCQPSWCCPLSPCRPPFLIPYVQRQRGPDVHEAAGGGGHRRGGGLPYGESRGLQYGMHTQRMCSVPGMLWGSPLAPLHAGLLHMQALCAAQIDWVVACLVLSCRWAPTRRRSCRASAWR